MHKGARLRAGPVCVFACVCGCMSVLTHALRPGTFTITDGQEDTTILVLLLLSAISLRAQHPGVTRPRGAPGQQSCGGGEGKAPRCCPSLLTGMKHEFFTRGASGVDGEASQEVTLREQCNKTHILRQDKKHINIKNFSAHLGLLPPL